MGYRISLYRCSKDQIEKAKNLAKNAECFWDVVSELKREEIRFDTLSHVLDTGYELENNLCSEPLKDFKLEKDADFYTISKEQLINIINYIRENCIYNYEIGNTVDFEKKEIGENIKQFIGCLNYTQEELWNESVKRVCSNSKRAAEEWDYSYKNSNGEKVYMNIDLDNKWLVTNGIGYKYEIFNLIHILKIFDWEKDCLVAIGC